MISFADSGEESMRRAAANYPPKRTAWTAEALALAIESAPTRYVVEALHVAAGEKFGHVDLDKLARLINAGKFPAP
jgi:hypothetical protein